MAKRKSPKRANEIPGDLWTVVVKLRGLGTLFRMASGEPPVDEEAFHGISYLISELADELDRIRDALEYGESN